MKDEEFTIVIPRRNDGKPKRFWYANEHVHHLRDDGTIHAWSIHCDHD